MSFSSCFSNVKEKDHNHYNYRQSVKSQSICSWVVSMLTFPMSGMRNHLEFRTEKSPSFENDAIVPPRDDVTSGDVIVA